MKVRAVFVSNSSSSSFIVALAQIGDEKFQALIELLEDGDSDGHRFDYEGNDNYLVIDTSYSEPDFESIGISEKDGISTYD